jgi:N-methylhydantoinase B/oxoprolinase/acetone carboxylase alpha subunit
MYVANVATFNNNVTIGASTTNSLTLNAATIVAPSALTVSSTGAIKLPSGTDAQRPTAAAGQIRYNTTAGRFEGYTTAWGGIGGGATGGGTDEVFQENGNTVNTSYTITTNKNAVSAGDITIASSATVTVPTGSRWIIV